MKIQSNQVAKHDERISRLVVIAETDNDHDLLADLAEYLKYRESELTNEEYATIRV